MKEKQPATCYFTREELRAIEEIEDQTERPRSKIVQFAVRHFVTAFKQDPEAAMKIAQSAKVN